MFFAISKVFHFLISPFTWIAALFILSFLIKNEKLKKRFRVVSLVLLLFFSNQFIYVEFARMWEVPAVDDKELGTYEAGIVLGGMLAYDSRLDRLQFFRSTDRLLQAVELYKKGIIKKILFTGGSGLLMHPEMKEGQYVKPFLMRLGIPEGDILIENESRNTNENAAFTAQLVVNHSLHGPFLLITSGIHLRRAEGCFKKQQMEVISYSTDRYSGPRKFELDFLFLPGASQLNNWDPLIHEWVGYLSYKIAGYI